MDRWQDKKLLLLLPLFWHGEDDPDNDQDDDPDDDNQDDSTNTDNESEDDENKSKTKTKKDKDDSDDPDDLPEDIEGLSAQELRNLLKLQSKELKKARVTSRKRLREIMEKKEKFKEIEAKQEAARLKELEEKEEFKKLYNELKPKYEVLTKDVSKTHTHFEKRLEQLKEELPEEYQKLIPEVDVREKISWIENFKNTILAKKKEEEKKTVSDNNTPPPTKTKATTSVGNSGNPPENPDKDKENDKSTIETAINNCSSPEELERLLAGLAKKGL